MHLFFPLASRSRKALQKASAVARLRVKPSLLGSWPAFEAAGKEDKRWSNALWDLQNSNGQHREKRLNYGPIVRAIRQTRIARTRAGAHTTGRQTPCGICHFAIALRIPPLRTSRAVTCAG